MGIAYTFKCGCVKAVKARECLNCFEPLILEASWPESSYRKNFMKNVLVSKIMTDAVLNIPKDTDFIIVRGKLTVKKLKLFKQLNKKFPNVTLLYQSFSLSASEKTLNYFLRAGYSRVSIIADLVRVKKRACVDTAEIEVGKIYVFNGGTVNQSELPRSPINLINDRYIQEYLQYFKPKQVASINDSNGVAHIECKALKINCFTHTVHPSLARDLRENNFMPKRSKLV